MSAVIRHYTPYTMFNVNGLMLTFAQGLNNTTRTQNIDGKIEQRNSHLM